MLVRQGYAACPTGQSLRLEILALSGGSSGNVEVSYKLRPTAAANAAVGAAVAADLEDPASAERVVIKEAPVSYPSLLRLGDERRPERLLIATAL